MCLVQCNIGRSHSPYPLRYVLVGSGDTANWRCINEHLIRWIDRLIIRLYGTSPDRLVSDQLRLHREEILHKTDHIHI